MKNAIFYASINVSRQQWWKNDKKIILNGGSQIEIKKTTQKIFFEKKTNVKLPKKVF